jgi:hypothetical protein
VSFEARNLPIPAGNRTFNLFDPKGNALRNDVSHEKDFAKGIRVDSNSRLELAIEYANKTYQEFSVRELVSNVSCSKSLSVLHFLSEGAEFLTLDIAAKNVSVTDINLVGDINKHLHGAFIPAPPWINQFISRQPDPIKSLLANQLQNGKIRRGLLTYLLLLKEGKQHE